MTDQPRGAGTGFVRILFICQYFPPEPGAPAARTHEHARAWARLGHAVTVVCGVPHYPEGVVPPAYRGRLLTREQMDGVTVLRCWMFAAKNRGVVLRSLSFLSFMLSSTVVAAFFAGPADVIAATSPQLLCGVSGWIAALRRRCPFIFEVRDLWPRQIVDLGVITSPLLIAPLRFLEKFLYRRAAAVVAVAPASRDALIADGVSADRVHCIPNGIELDFFRPLPRMNAVRERHGWDENTFVVLYIGAHGLSQGLETVLDAARLLADRPDIRFVFAGGGARRDALIDRAGEMGLDKVSFLSARPKAEMPEYYAAADVCLVPLLKREVFETNIPSKMFEIMACARPMILGAGGQARALLEEAGAGIAVPPENPDALADAILSLKENPGKGRAYGEAGRAHAERHCNRADRAQEYVALFGSVVGGGE